MAITIDRVTKRFGDFVALDNVSVDVADGELTALLAELYELQDEEEITLETAS